MDVTDHDPDDVIAEAERRQEAIAAYYVPAVEWFLERTELHLREAAVENLGDSLEVETATAGAVVSHLIEDAADPVQQVVQPGGDRYVGVIDHTEHDWFYAFDRYDDVDGRQRRAVCAHCVHEERSDAEVAHFTRPPDEYTHDAARVALGLHYHLDHEDRPLAAVLAADLDVDPAAVADRLGLPGGRALSLRDITRNLRTVLSDPGEAADRLSVPEVDVQPGASLVSGTTIGGNTAWHAGNDGAGSGLDADTVDAEHAAALEATLHRDRHGNAYIGGSTRVGRRATSLSTTSDTTVTVSVSTSHGAVFATGTAQELTLATIRRNGSTVSPNTAGALVTDVASGDRFEFVFHAPTILSVTAMTGTIEYATFT